MSKQNKGFTLIELIIVVAIIALLAGATFVAINPAKRIGEANNAQRWADVTAIASAWALHVADEGGTAPASATAGTTYQIANGAGSTHCADGSGHATTTTAHLDLSSLVTDGYLGNIPADPEGTTFTGTNSGYYLYSDANGVIKVGACITYNSAVIEVTR